MFIKAGENIKNRTVTKMPESQNTEWKSKWKDEYLEWICGYANAQGGKIYIGCDDEGNVVGLPNASRLFRWTMWMTKHWLILSSGPPKRDALTKAFWMSQKMC